MKKDTLDKIKTIKNSRCRNYYTKKEDDFIVECIKEHGLNPREISDIGNPDEFDFFRTPASVEKRIINLKAGGLL